MRNSFLIIFTLVTLVSFTGCFGPPDFSNQPEIAFNSIQIRDYPAVPQFADSVIISINFQDGDGDLGLNEIDTLLTQFKAQTINDNGDTVNNPFFNNYFLTIIRRSGNVLDTPIVNAFVDPDASNFDSRFPHIGDGSGALEGILKFDFFIPYKKNGGGIFATPFNFGDIIYFDVQIADRERNLSNIATTSEIVLGSPD